MIQRYLKFDRGAVCFWAGQDERCVAASDMLSRLVEEYSPVALRQGVFLSFLYPRKVSADQLATYDVKLNFHPAPLPEYRGFAPYTWGILNNATMWGATCHHMIDELDAGEVVHKVMFPIHNPTQVTAEALRAQTTTYLLDVFRSVVTGLLIGLPVRAAGVLHTKADFEQERMKVLPGSDVLVDRYRRAFHCPPHKGFNEI